MSRRRVGRGAREAQTRAPGPLPPTLLAPCKNFAFLLYKQSLDHVTANMEPCKGATEAEWRRNNCIRIPRLYTQRCALALTGGGADHGPAGLAQDNGPRVAEHGGDLEATRAVERERARGGDRRRRGCVGVGGREECKALEGGFEGMRGQVHRFKQPHATLLALKCAIYCRVGRYSMRKGKEGRVVCKR
jgi:hypothetical protein